MEGRKYNDSTPDVLPSAKGDLEYIVPMKISQNQYEDPPDPFTTAKRHHSGHFRHATAKVWDPHPQYEFTAFGKFFRLRLSHDTSFISPDMKVTHISANTSRKVHPGHQLDCFYSGYIDGDPHSIVTVNLCHGMYHSSFNCIRTLPSRNNSTEIYTAELAFEMIYRRTEIYKQQVDLKKHNDHFL
uniref:Peptidase M12B propeptide domain-containing protein n=1 Tax=Vespula pensylvanica TaxID=30213 RepID=A0A834P9R1_VESPE|nr:hypothetical protein H0235_002287 [Vespula pensylvanica]